MTEMSNTKLVFERISDKYTKIISDYSKGPMTNLSEIIVKPSGCVLPKEYLNFVEALENFEVYPDDTWVITYPKAGTTWTQEMVWLLKNNFDYEKAKTTPITLRVPFLEHQAIATVSEFKANLLLPIEETAKMPRPRCIKCHLPAQLLPKKMWTVKPKIVYVSRDPRDVAVSYFHHYKLWTNFTGSMEDFMEVFLNDKCIYGPFWGHVFGYHDLKDKSHILFNTYEEMIRDLKGVIRKTAQFLNVNVTDEQVDKLNDHLSFKNMKNNAKVNYTELLNPIVENYGKEAKKDDLKFMRTGKSGGWKEVLNDDIVEKFQKWNEHHLKGRPFKDYPW